MGYLYFLLLIHLVAGVATFFSLFFAHYMRIEKAILRNAPNDNTADRLSSG